MKLVVKMKFGSHLYGTNNENSDIDYKGIFMPSKKEVLLGKIPKCYNFSTGNNHSKNTPVDKDIEIFSLHYFIKMACEGQTVALDMLHAPQEMVIESSELWLRITKMKKEFYTKNLKAFIGYARRQAAKYGIKGSRLNVVAETLRILKAGTQSNKMSTLWDVLPRGEHCHDIDKNTNGIRQYQICGKTFQETAAIGYVTPILEQFYDNYGARARQAAKNKNIDWKAVSHAVRAAMQVKELLLENDIAFPLKDAAVLLQIKEGNLDYITEVAPLLENLIEEVEAISLISKLPKKVNTDIWDKFICDEIEKEYFI